MPNKEACDTRNGRCSLLPHKGVGHCFEFCDLSSDVTCGQCANWYGIVEDNGSRHEFYGTCPYQFKHVCSHWRCRCPHFFQREEGRLPYPDWVEYRAAQLGLAYETPSRAARCLMRMARMEWLYDHRPKKQGE